jgi:hypothetical protein
VKKPTEHKDGYIERTSARLFRKYNGMFVYLSNQNNWGKESVKTIETNDPIEAAKYSGDYRLGRHIDPSEGEWVVVEIETRLRIEEG